MIIVGVRKRTPDVDRRLLGSCVHGRYHSQASLEAVKNQEYCIEQGLYIRRKEHEVKTNEV